MTSPSSSHTFMIRRFTSCTLLISSENTATGVLKFIAMFFAIESTNAVFPMAGRAAIIIKSDFCQPAVILSMPVNPLLSPLKPFLFSIASLICLKASLMTGLICVKSFFRLFCEISNSCPSASCIRSSTSIVSSNALSWISAVNLISSLARYFCAIIRAWNSICALLATFSVSFEI